MALKVMKVHDIAKLFPILPSREMKDLRSDIAANGIVVPILVNKKRDTILDGRNRWMIANELKLNEEQVPMETFEGEDEDIPSEILSRNIFRRHLSDDQRITLLAKVLAPKLQEEATARKTKKGSFGADKAGPKGTVAAQLAKAGKTSKHKAEQALKVNKAGFAEEVIEGKTKLGKAAKKAGTTKRRAPKVKTFEEEVWAKYDAWLKRTWDITQHRKVRAIIHKFTEPAPAKP